MIRQALPGGVDFQLPPHGAAVERIAFKVGLCVRLQMNKPVSGFGSHWFTAAV